MMIRSCGYQRGFVLAITLWLMAIVTVAAGLFALWTAEMRENLQQDQVALQGEIDVQSTLDILLYLFASQQMTVAGLTVRPMPPTSPTRSPLTAEESVYSIAPIGGEIALDDHVYRGVGSAYFAVQDERGLVPMNPPADHQLSSLLRLYGVEEDIPALMAALRDYADPNDFHRLNGAEAPAYRERGLPDPPNRRLFTPQELMRVLGWREQTALWHAQRLGRVGTAAPLGMPNINTASSSVLATIAGVDLALADEIVEERKKKPFMSLTDVSRRLRKSIPLDDLDAFFFPSRYQRLTLWYQGARQERVIHLKLTPWAGAGMQPWSIEYALLLPLAKPHANINSEAVPAPLPGATDHPDLRED